MSWTILFLGMIEVIDKSVVVNMKYGCQVLFFLLFVVISRPQ